MSCSASPATPLPALRRSSCWPGPHWPKLQGADPAPVRVRAALANGFGKPSPLRRFVRATLMGGVVTLPKGGHFSGGIGALAGCNCLVDVPAGSRALNAGDEVEVILL